MTTNIITEKDSAEKVESVDVSQAFEIDPDEERAVVRKLDMVIMPMMALVYFFQYLDKASINQAAIFGLRKDLHLTGEDFSWAISLFYLGQLVAEYLAVYLLSRLHLTRSVGATIIAWGVVNMCMGAIQDFHGLAATRFFLGFTEAAVSPAFVIITSVWYRRREHAIRTAVWVSMNGVSTIFGSLIMYGIGHSSTTLAPWRALFIVCGGLTTACGILFLLVMPRDTRTAWFLKPNERELATKRLALDRATRDKAQFNKGQLQEALKSPMTWLYFFMALCITLTTPILKFNATVINGFGYSQFKTMLVGMPAGAVSTATVWVGALVPRFFPGTRVYTAIGLSIVPLTGAILLMVLPAHMSWGIVASTWLAGSMSSMLSISASLISSNVKGNTKKSVVSAGFFIAYCVGCIVSPQAWTQKDAPRYTKGCILSIASLVALMISYVVYVFMVKSENKKRDLETVDEVQADGIDEESDLTDIQDRGFRYTI
ncbi:MFS general substrate transporter [Pyrenochaeta sp. DS3sAY3a]|nr:MFS general substrate transporter [Pyrenochaeta sp. DS3sAY3a]